MINTTIYELYEALFQRRRLYLKSNSITAAMHFMAGIKHALETTAREQGDNLQWKHSEYPGFEFDRYLCEKLNANNFHEACKYILKQSTSKEKALETLAAHFQSFQKENQPSNMQELLSKLKGYFPKATVTLLDGTMVQVLFPKAKESIIIQVQEERYTVSYPKLIVDGVRKIKKEETITSSNILWAGTKWILKQVEKHGRVLPEFGAK